MSAAALLLHGPSSKTLRLHVNAQKNIGHIHALLIFAKTASFARG